MTETPARVSSLRACSISSCKVNGKLVGPVSVLADWKFRLTQALEFMCLQKAQNLDVYSLSGHWLQAVDIERNVYRLVISFPPLPAGN